MFCLRNARLFTIKLKIRMKIQREPCTKKIYIILYLEVDVG